MKRFAWAALALLYCMSCNGLRAQSVRDDGLLHTLGPEWKSFYGVRPDAGYHVIELVRNGETVRDWTEMVAIEDNVEPPKAPPEEAVNKWIEKWGKKCPGTIQSKIISKDETSALFEMHAEPCRGLPEEEDVGRIIQGKYSWYVLVYQKKVHELTPEIRAQWNKTFSDATFDSVTLPFDPIWMSVDVDETVPFAMDKVYSAVKSAMSSQDCQVTSEAAGKIQCKRPGMDATTKEHRRSGPVSVIVELEASGSQTRVNIKTDLGFSARLPKHNISTPVYEEMMKTLEAGQP